MLAVIPAKEVDDVVCLGTQVMEESRETKVEDDSLIVREGLGLSQVDEGLCFSIMEALILTMAKV